MVDSETTWRGGEGQLALLMQGLLHRGYDVTLASPPGSAIESRGREFGVECLPLAISGGFDLGAAWKLRGYLRRRQYDVVHTHSSHAHSVAFMAERIGRPPRGGDGTRLVVSRRVDFRVATNGFSALKYRRGADVYVAISHGVRKVLLECGVPAERIELVRSGIDMKKFEKVRDPEYLRTEFGLDAGTRVVGNVAALAPHKAQADFLRAAKYVSRNQEGVRFFIVGEGELRGSLERLIEELGLRDHVVLTGFRQDALEFIALFDCFVLSSRLEGLCTSIMDAHALGTPVVGTNTGGVPDLVHDGETGLLAPPGDPDALGRSIVRMLEDGDLAASCAASARERANAEYDCRHMIDGTIEVYRRVMEADTKVH